MERGMKKIFTILLLFLVLPVVALAQSGQLRGTITDQETGEPLIGANVLVVGSTQGAATDVNGEYIILNLIADTYEIRSTYIGYQAKTISNVRVVSGLTLEVNFQLAAEGIQVGEVEVIAQRPLVNKYNTNANRIVTSEDIDALPVRGINNILAVTPGVVVQDNAVFIRGGRQDEVGYYLEGTNITDPMVGGSQVFLVQDALEEIQVQSGGYTAEFGGANSGIIKQQIKTGTPDWKFSFEFITDNIGFQGSDDRYAGEQVWGAYWYGYNEVIATFGGPLFTPNIKFFGLFNSNFIRDRTPQDLPGINLGEITDAISNPNDPTTIDLVYPAGARQASWGQSYTGTSSITFDFNPSMIRLVGTYTTFEGPNPWAATRDLTLISNFRNVGRTEMVNTDDMAFNLKYTYLISATSFLELNGGYSFNKLSRFDPDLKDRWLEYGDGKANEEFGYDWPYNPDAPVGEQNRYDTPLAENLFNFKFFPVGANVSAYQNFDRQRINVSASYSSQISTEHNIKVGGEYQSYDIANWSLGNEPILKLPGKIASDPQKIDTLIRREGVNNFGYNPQGEKTNSGIPDYEQSRKPNFMGIYVQDRMEYKDLIINVVLRYDRIDIDNWIPIDPQRPDLTWDRETLDVIASGIAHTEAKDYVSPRLGFSFAVTDETIFHAQWGKFIQQSRLRDIYQGLNATGNNVGGGFFIGSPVGFDVSPTRTTQYDVGFTQQIGEFASFDITGFYKDIQDQVVYSQVNVIESQFGDYAALQNGDVATIKGVEITYNMRRIERFKADANISFTSAQGTGSQVNSNRGIVGAPLDPTITPDGFTPQYISPLDFNQSIRGALNVDYRFGKGDGGPVFQELGLTFLTTYSSGHPYTRGAGTGSLELDARFRRPLEPLNSSTTPSILQVDMRLDKTFNIADALDINIYLWVINLFDTQNIQNVFARTGSGVDDGYLGDPNLGGQQVATFGEDYARVYNALYLDYHQQWYDANTSAAILTQPIIYGPPRQIRFGIRLEY